MCCRFYLCLTTIIYLGLQKRCSRFLRIIRWLYPPWKPHAMSRPLRKTWIVGKEPSLISLRSLKWYSKCRSSGCIWRYIQTHNGHACFTMNCIIYKNVLYYTSTCYIIQARAKIYSCTTSAKVYLCLNTLFLVTRIFLLVKIFESSYRRSQQILIQLMITGRYIQYNIMCSF